MTTSRRTFLGVGAGGLLASNATALPRSAPRITVEAGHQDIRPYEKIHHGLGSIGVRLFGFGGAPAPANFLVYEIPPGASEGVHVHTLADPALGPYDEYYYVISGQGAMLLDGRTMPIGAGDHVHTPLGLPHGVANTHDRDMLRIFLTYIDRSSAA